MRYDRTKMNDEPCYWERYAVEVEAMLARAVHATDLSGEQWRKDALALLNRAHPEEPHLRENQ